MRWERGRKERTMETRQAPVVHFSIKTSCFLSTDRLSTHFTVLVSTWTTLHVRLIKRIISLGRWCNVLVSLLRERCNGISKFFFLWLEREGWNYYETWRYLMRKDKIWCRWLGKYVIAGRNYAAPRELSWTKNSYFAFSRVMQDFLRSVGFSLKRTRARPRRLDNERHAFFPFFLSVPVSNGNCSFLLTRFILFFGAYCMYKKNESMKLGDWIFFKVKFRRRLNEIEGISTL